jgi:RsiW-degrading membrane proteinase PrsW (M82 family)
MISNKLLQIALAGALAIIPALFWGYIFYKKQPENKVLCLRLFLCGAVSVAPLLLYKYLWQFFPWINAFTYTNTFNDDMIGFANFSIIPVNVLLTFMFVGLIEEIAKFMAVRLIHKKICSITDSIEFFIIVALGFAFAENIIYIYSIMQARGVDNILLPFIFRSLFSTFAHVMFSGTLGFFYGQATLAKPLLQESYNQDRWTWIRIISERLHLNKFRLFHDEQAIKGLMVAIALHAFFNIFLEMNWTFLIIPFLTIGFIYLSYLFDNKRVDKEYCSVNN